MEFHGIDSPLGKNQNLVVVLPRSLHRKFLQIVHDSPLGGHMGRDRTCDRTRGLLWWPGVKADVAKYVASCDVHQHDISMIKLGKCMHGLDY